MYYFYWPCAGPAQAEAGGGGAADAREGGAAETPQPHQELGTRSMRAAPPSAAAGGGASAPGAPAPSERVKVHSPPTSCWLRHSV